MGSVIFLAKCKCNLLFIYIIIRIVRFSNSYCEPYCVYCFYAFYYPILQYTIIHLYEAVASASDSAIAGRNWSKLDCPFCYVGKMAFV